MKTTKNRDLQFRLFWDGEIESKTAALLNEYAADIATPGRDRAAVNIGLDRIDGICELAALLGFSCEYNPDTNKWTVKEK